MHIQSLAPLLSLLLASCASVPLLQTDESAVVYALGSREGFASPLSAPLTPACPSLSFPADSHEITGQHRLKLQRIAEGAKQTPVRLLIVGHTSPKLPEDYARSLSERRAQGVRQHLIELGMEASAIHTLGLGNDFAPSAPASDVVIIYQAAAPSEAAAE